MRFDLRISDGSNYCEMWPLDASQSRNERVGGRAVERGELMAGPHSSATASN